MLKRIWIILCAWLFLLPGVCFAGTISTSGVTAQDIIDRVRYDLRETADSGTTLFWSDTEIIQWTNEAVVEIVNRTRCLESAALEIVVQANDRDYSISGNWLDIEKVEYDIGVSGVTTKKSQVYDLERAPFRMLRFNQEKEIGDPKTFSIWNDTLYVFPIPRSAQSGNTLYVYRATLPSGVTTASSPIETPAYFDPAILYYVKGKALFKEGNEANGFFYMQLFNSMVSTYRKDIMRRE